MLTAACSIGLQCMGLCLTVYILRKSSWAKDGDGGLADTTSVVAGDAPNADAECGSACMNQPEDENARLCSGTDELSGESATLVSTGQETDLDVPQAGFHI